jgi:hypothetical protein
LIASTKLSCCWFVSCLLHVNSLSSCLSSNRSVLPTAMITISKAGPCIHCVTLLCILASWQNSFTRTLKTGMLLRQQGISDAYIVRTSAIDFSRNNAVPFTKKLMISTNCSSHRATLPLAARAPKLTGTDDIQWTKEVPRTSPRKVRLRLQSAVLNLVSGQ